MAINNDEMGMESGPCDDAQSLDMHKSYYSFNYSSSFIELGFFFISTFLRELSIE
jgi:hypothetical protein